MLAREVWKAWAVPWKTAWTPAGRVSRARRSISRIAGPMAAWGLRLKEMVTEGSCPRWLTVRGATVSVRRATARRGTSSPPRVRR